MLICMMIDMCMPWALLICSKKPKEQKAEEVKFMEETTFGKNVETEFNKEDTKREKNKGRFRENDDAEVVPPIISSSRSDEGNDCNHLIECIFCNENQVAVNFD
jgi:hypothetical protein